LALPISVQMDSRWPAEAVKSTQEYLATARALQDRTYWPVLMFVSTNLFLWHLDAFKKLDDPTSEFADKFKRATAFLNAAVQSEICGNNFIGTVDSFCDDASFESHVSGLFSDVWLDMTDDIYFDETFEFTRTRFEKSGVDPYQFFKDKVVLDAGCGSGKFSTAIAKFGAKKVVGVDIGERGLSFAKEQASKIAHGDRLVYQYGSLLDLPFEGAEFDIVWSNGVIHHTLGYEKCLSEFARVTKKGGSLFLYVNGRMGLLELLMDTLRVSTQVIPRALFQHFLRLQGINSGRLYWMMDFLYAPYEWKSKTEVLELLAGAGYKNVRQLTRGVQTDQIEQISSGLPYAELKYGDGQLKFIAEKC